MVCSIPVKTNINTQRIIAKAFIPAFWNFLYPYTARKTKIPHNEDIIKQRYHGSASPITLAATTPSMVDTTPGRLFVAK